MRIPDLESLIEDSEKTSTNYVDDTDRQNLIDEATWMQWAEQQLAEAQREMNKLPYVSPDENKPIELVPGSNPLAGVTWRMQTSGSSNGSWVNSVPVTLTAPQAHTSLIMPKIGYHT